MGLFINQLFFRIQYCPFYQQHLISLVFIICLISPVIIYWEIDNHGYATELKIALEEQLNLKSSYYTKQIIESAKRSPNQTANDETKHVGAIDFISYISDKWPVKYQQTSTPFAKKSRFKFSIILPHEQLPYYLEKFKQKASEYIFLTIRITPYNMISNYLNLELELENVTSMERL